VAMTKLIADAPGVRRTAGDLCASASRASERYRSCLRPIARSEREPARGRRRAYAPDATLGLKWRFCWSSDWGVREGAVGPVARCPSRASGLSSPRHGMGGAETTG